jgi:hypothetical protein
MRVKYMLGSQKARMLGCRGARKWEVKKLRRSEAGTPKSWEARKQDAGKPNEYNLF